MTQRAASGGARHGVIGLLDIGTTKVACLVAVWTPGGSGPRYRTVGLGQHASRGLRAGVITDLDEAEQSVRGAVAQAERAAGTTLDEVYVSLACGRLQSTVFKANADVAGGVVGDGDISRLMAGGRAYAERDGRSLVHMNRINLLVDGAAGFKDPRGLAGQRISAEIHAVTADDAPMRNLLVVVERARLEPVGLAVAPFASSLAATTAEERRIGVTCIDIGGGTTKIAVLADGQLLHTDVIAVGGNHITYDIARTLQTPLAEAERIKALYGTLAGAPSDEHEILSYPLAGEEEGASSSTTRAELAGIVRGRMTSLVDLILERLGRSAFAHAGERVVLTGGGSQLTGAASFMANAMERPVRVARPYPMPGMPGGVCGPAFATVAGLLEALNAGGGGVMTCRRRHERAVGYLGRVGAWIREGF